MSPRHILPLCSVGQIAKTATLPRIVLPRPQTGDTLLTRRQQTLDILDTDNSQWARNFLDVIMWCAKLPPDHHYCSGPENFAH